MTTDQVTLRQALEQLLKDNAAVHPGFIERAVLDPKGTVEPMIAALTGDDGDLDLSGVNVNVHIATPNTIHLVLEAGEDEVSGYRFDRMSIGGLDIGQMVLQPRPIFGATDTSCSGSDASCHTDSGETNYCGGCK